MTAPSPLTDLNDLAYFAAVAEHGGFAAAERAIGVPKSKLSRRVAQLEARLGTRLIQRTTRRFALTDTGLAVLEHARAMLAEAQAAEALVAADAATPRGTVRLSCPPALLQSAVAPMLARYLNAWPQVRLQVHATNANVDVWEGRVDLALRVRPPGGPLPREETVRPLALSPHVLVASGESGMAAEVDAALAALGQARRIAVRLPHWTVASEILMGTDLISTVARRAVQGNLAQGLALYSPPFAIAPFRFETIRHRRTDGDAGIAWLRAAIAKTVEPG